MTRTVYIILFIEKMLLWISVIDGTDFSEGVLFLPSTGIYLPVKHFSPFEIPIDNPEHMFPVLQLGYY